MLNTETENMSAKRVDHDNDGVVSEREIELELKMEKAGTQMRIAIVAIASMIVTMALLLSPWGPELILLNALDSAISTFFVAMASIVGAYMGFTAWMSKNN
jgi:hypothetical protein